MNTVMPNAVIPSVGAAALIQELRDCLDALVRECDGGYVVISWDDLERKVEKGKAVLEWARTFDWEAT